MILTLTMNPAVDIGYTVETLKMDTVNRTQKVSKTPGGKGLNVSRVLKQLGSPVLATGLLGGHIGAFIKEKLDEVALENNFYPIQSETRNCIAILHEGLQTEILEAGPTITPEEQAGFLAHFETLLKEVDLITISGSLPAGMDETLYATIIEKAAKASIPVLLDTSGKTLKMALEASTNPALIKPNQEELAGLLGVPEATTVEELKKQLNSPVFDGVDWVVVSLGSKGAIAKHDCVGVYRGFKNLFKNFFYFQLCELLVIVRLVKNNFLSDFIYNRHRMILENPADFIITVTW